MSNPRHEKRAERAAKARQMRREGKTVADIAKELGVRNWAVHGYLRESEVLPPAEIRAIQVAILRRAGFTNRRIAELIGTTSMTVMRVGRHADEALGQEPEETANEA